MITRIRSILERSQPLRYITVGGIGYVFEMLVLFIAVSVLHTGNAAAVTASYWLGLAFSFTLQKVLAFGSRDTRASVLGTQAVFYALLVLFNYGFTVIFAALTAPAIGIFLSRTIALLITTVWNFFVYRTIIFNNQVTGASAPPALWASRVLGALGANTGGPLLSGTAIVLTTVFALMSLSANPVADDYAYFANLQEAPSPWAYISDHYLTHNGRLSQNVVVTLAFIVFGKSATQVMPLLLFLALSAALAWVFALLLRGSERRVPLALSLGAVATALSLFTVPSTTDSYLWLTSSTVYLGSLIGFTTSIGLAISLARMPRMRFWAVAPTLVWMFFAQSFSEPTALLAIAAAGLWGLWTLVTRDWRRLAVAALCFGALVAGFMVVFLSPGTSARRAELDVPFSIRRIVFGSFDLYPQLFAGLSPWVLALVLLAGLVTARSLSKVRSRKRFHSATLSLALLIFLGSSYLVFAASNYGSTYFPYRNFTLPAFGLIVALGFVAVSACRAVLDLSEDGTLASYSTLITVILAGTAIVPALLVSGEQLQALALRDSAAAAREAQLVNQIAAGSPTVAVQAVPVLLTSEAVELENPPAEQVDWLLSGFRSWYDIPAETSLEITPVSSTYCMPERSNVKPEFVCR